MLKKNDILNTSFDRYLIIEQIGAGGNGTVYKVKNEEDTISCRDEKERSG